MAGKAGLVNIKWCSISVKFIFIIIYMHICIFKQVVIFYFFKSIFFKVIRSIFRVYKSVTCNVKFKCSHVVCIFSKFFCNNSRHRVNGFSIICYPLPCNNYHLINCLCTNMCLFSNCFLLIFPKQSNSRYRNY